MCIMTFSKELEYVFIQTILNNKLLLCFHVACIWADSKSCLSMPAKDLVAEKALSV